MILIDIDEGVPIGQDLLTRKNEYGRKGQEDWYIGLSYPNFYVKDPLKYTKAQLIASFLYLLPRISEAFLENEILSDYLNLKDALKYDARKLGNMLADLDKQKVDFSKVVQETRSEVNEILDSSYSLMSGIMNYNHGEA